jgi:hypothetical protein
LGAGKDCESAMAELVRFTSGVVMGPEMLDPFAREPMFGTYILESLGEINEKGRMLRQRSLMDDYANVLDERIVNFKE